jgi:DNA-binding response OmpR family regulator
MPRILLVEDDQRIGALVRAELQRSGHDVVWNLTGHQAVEVARVMLPDLVLLDLGLPDVDGIDVCRLLRAEHPDVVIVMLTARGDDMDVIAGLESGADDYVTKPFGMIVLLARVAAHLRRVPPHDDAPVFVDGDLVIDPASRRCLIAGREVTLRAKQFDLLDRLAREPGRAVSRAALMADVWGEDVQQEGWSGSTKTLDVHIATLRQQLATSADRAIRATGRSVRLPRITTVRNIGYRLDHHRTPPA